MLYDYRPIEEDERAARKDGARRLVAHTAAGPIYTQRGVVWMYPLHTALQRMRELHFRVVEPRRPVSLAAVQRQGRAGARALHQRAVQSALATLRVASDADRAELCRGVFQYARAAGSSDGIESVLLTAIVTAGRLSPALARTGLDTWSRVGAPAHLGAGLTHTPVLDPASSVVSFLSLGDLHAFGRGLAGTSTGAGAGALAGGTIPGPRHGNGGPGGLAPGEAETDKDGTCVAIFTVGGAVIGAIGGGVLGNAAPGSSAGTGTKDVATGAGVGTGLLAGASGGQSLGQALCGNAASTNAPASSNTPAPANDTGGDAGGGSTTGSQDLTGYNDGFAAGWAAATSTDIAPSATTGSGWAQGYADGAAAAEAMGTLNTGTTSSTDGSTASGGTTDGTPTDGTPTDGTPTDGTPTDNTPTNDGGPTPSSASTPAPDDDSSAGSDREGANRLYTHGSATGPGLAGVVTKLSGGNSFIISGIGQLQGAGGGAVPGVVGHGPDDRDGSDEGTDGSQSSLSLSGHISVSLPPGRDPELNPHALAALTAAVAALTAATQ